MVEVTAVEPPVSVTFPWMRREVIHALAALSDEEYQERVWIRGVFPTADYYDDLDENVHILYDDVRVLPEPATRELTVLVPGIEVVRLRELESVLGPMIDERPDWSDAQYLADPRWPQVRARAGAALAAMTSNQMFVDAPR
jgi:hypothetical protein